jgi:hypothetical protein
VLFRSTGLAKPDVALRTPDRRPAAVGAVNVPTRPLLWLGLPVDVSTGFESRSSARLDRRTNGYESLSSLLAGNLDIMRFVLVGQSPKKTT